MSFSSTPMTAAAHEMTTGSAEETEALGAALAPWLRAGDVLLLHGDLGAGKTVLARGIAAALGIESVVASPSFALVNEYETGLLALFPRLYHLDLFRLQELADLDSIGFVDLLAPSDGITLIEWPERAIGALPDRYLLVEIEAAGADRRRIAITPFPNDDSWADRFADLRRRLSTRDS